MKFELQKQQAYMEKLNDFSLVNQNLYPDQGISGMV
jgi:hypothetical protein